MKKLFAWFLAFISVLFFIIAVFLTSIELVSFDIGFYKEEYDKLDRPEAIGMSDAGLTETTRALMDYLRGKRDDLNIEEVIKGEKRSVFNQREISHMKDVRELFQRGYNFRMLAVVLMVFCSGLLFYLVGKAGVRYLSISFIVAFLLLLVAFGVLMVLIYIDFTPVWDQFHYIFFDNDLWQLNPKSDILIQMVPEKFFFDAVMRITMYFAGVMALVLLLACRFVVKTKI